MTSTTGLCYAQGEHSRRAGAELRVLSGDVRLLIELAAAQDHASATPLLQQVPVEPRSNNNSPVNKSPVKQSPTNKSLVKKGLIDRIRGSLAAIDILLRLADQESGRTAVHYAALVQDARDYIDAEQWNKLAQLLASVEKQFPLQLPRITESALLLESSRKLHQSLCAACHDSPVQRVERPAYNLYRQSRSTADSEFFARMLVGVRGDRVTGIDNPFSDVEIAGLMLLYRSGADR